LIDEKRHHTNYVKSRFYYGWYLVAISWLATFVLGGTATSLYFKPMLDEFGWDRATLSLIGAICLLVSAVISPFIGKFIDRFGPRAMIFCTLAIQSLSNIIYGFAGNLGTISAGRLLVEFKPSTGGQVLVNRWFVRMRGRALGILSTGTPFGTLILSPLSQHLINTWGWRITLFFWAGIIIIFLLPTTALIRNKPEDKGFAPDGEILPYSGSTSGSSGINIINSTNEGSSVSEALRKPSFWLLTGTQFFCGIGCGLWMTHLVIFATDLGYSAMIGASFLSVQGGASLIGVLITGQISDFWSRNKVLGMTHFTRGLSFFVVIAALLLGGGSLWMLFAAMALFGLGWFTTAPLSVGLVADLFGNRSMGTLIGVILSAHLIGSAIGTYGGGYIYQITGSYMDVFITQGILEMVAMLFAFAIVRKKK
jgi:predicted MFS family arabinose efflux permease